MSNRTRDRKGRFARRYIGCRVGGCPRTHYSKGFCRRHLKAFERGRVDADGRIVPLRCRLCGVLYIPRTAQSRFCRACRPRWVREREKRWKQDNRSIVHVRQRGWKQKHRDSVRRREREHVRVERAKLRSTDPAEYRQQLDSHDRRQKLLQELSLKFVTRRGRWSQRETELLASLYPKLARGDGWQRLFEIVGRSYISIRGKWQALCRAKRGSRH